MQMMFKDPYSSLNPRKTVGSIVGGPFVIHGVEYDEGKRKRRAEPDGAGRPQPRALQPLPHEFSGGLARQLGIAEAIALKPKLVVADEPVSALDVSIQAQIISLLTELQRELTIIFIAHDFSSVVRHVVRPRRGHVPRQGGGAGPGRPALRPPAPSLHRRAAPAPCRCRPEKTRAHEAARGAGRRRALADEPAALPLPHALPEDARGPLRRGGAAARAQGGRQPGRLPLPADRRRVAEQVPVSRGRPSPGRWRSRRPGRARGALLLAGGAEVRGPGGARRRPRRARPGPAPSAGPPACASSRPAPRPCAASSTM